MPKKPDTKWTVAIRPAAGKPLYKITKIISLNGVGFSVLTPYHKAHSGLSVDGDFSPSRLEADSPPDSKFSSLSKRRNT
jgi:hypothetical protein